MTKIKKFFNIFAKEAHIIPIIVSLFLVPIFFESSFVYSFTQGKELLFKSVLLLTLLVLGFVILFKKKWKLRSFSGSVLAFLLLVQFSIFTLTDVFSPTPVVALHGTYSRGFGFIIELFLLFFVFYTAWFASKKNVLFALKVAILSGFCVALYALLQKFGLELFFVNYDTNIFAGRVFSFSGNPSYLGQIMLLYFIAAGYFLFESKAKWQRWLYGVLAILFLLVLILSGTRSSLLGVAFAFVLLLLKFRKQLKYFVTKKVVMMVLLPILICSFAAGFLLNDRYSFSNVALRSLKSRVEIWNGALSLVEDRLLLGYGGETFYIYFPEIVSKKFFALEEDINLNADRLHNEMLEVLFAHGIFALAVYLLMGAVLLGVFFKSKDRLFMLLSLIPLAGIFQNQFGFPDISISVFVAFCLGALIALSIGKTEKGSEFTWRWRCLVGFVLVVISVMGAIFAIYRPYLSQLAYAKSKSYYSVDYDVAINKHKEALSYTPYYSELWYELMFIDPSSMERALFYLKQIDGNSGNVLAWKGNFYAYTDPAKATQYYMAALEKNPHHPNWIRAFADMLYKAGDYENALFLYMKYLDAIPDYWRWGLTLEGHSEEEKSSYRAFIKNSPYILETLRKINGLVELKGSF